MIGPPLSDSRLREAMVMSPMPASSPHRGARLRRSASMLLLAAFALAACSAQTKPGLPDALPEGILIAADPTIGRLYAVVRTDSGEPADCVRDLLIILDQSGEHVATIPVGLTPEADVSAIAVDTRSHRVYLPHDFTERGAEVRAEMDGSARAPVPPSPVGIQVPDEHGYVTVVDGRTARLAGHRETPGGFLLAAVDPSSDRLYAAENSLVDPAALSLRTFRVEQRLPARVDPPLTVAMAVDPSRKRLYLAAEEPGTLIAVDTGRNRQTARVSLKPYRPHDVAVDEHTGRVFVSDVDDPFVHVLDHRGRTLGTIVLEDLGEHHLAVDSNTGRVFVADFGGALSIIDGRRGTVRGTVVLGKGLLDVAAGDGRAYVIDERGTLFIVDGSARRVEKEIALGDLVTRAAPAPDGAVRKECPR